MEFAYFGVTDVERVLGWQFPGVLEPGQDAESGPAGLVLDNPVAFREQGRISPELVDQEAHDPLCITGIEDGACADKLRDDPATVDVADENDRNVSRLREAHVGNVPLAQVHLCGRSRPLDQDKIMRRAESPIAFENGGHQICLQFSVFPGLDGRMPPPLDDDLGAGVGFRFQQDGIHVGVRLQTCREGLKCLGAADFSAVCGDGGIGSTCSAA